MAPQKNEQEFALKAYLRNAIAAQSELDELAAKLEDNFGNSPDDITWAHVSDVANILRLLREANGKESA